MNKLFKTNIEHRMWILEKLKEKDAYNVEYINVNKSSILIFLYNSCELYNKKIYLKGLMPDCYLKSSKDFAFNKHNTRYGVFFDIKNNRTIVMLKHNLQQL